MEKLVEISEPNQIQKSALDILTHSNQELNPQVLDTLLKSAVDNPGIYNLSLSQIKDMTRSAEMVSEKTLPQLLLNSSTMDPSAKTAASLVFAETSASNTWKPGLLERLVAAQLLDTQAAAATIDGHIDSLQKSAWQGMGDIAGLCTTSISFTVASQTLKDTSAALPIPGPMKAAITIGSALVLGGFVNNAIAGRELVAPEGYYRNTALSGMVYGSAEFGAWLLEARTERLFPTLAGLTATNKLIRVSADLDSANSLEKSWSAAKTKFKSMSNPLQQSNYHSDFLRAQDSFSPDLNFNSYPVPKF